MIIYRYLFGQIIKVSMALLLGLMTLILFNRFSHYISNAAEGEIPVELVATIVINRLPDFMGVVFPLTLLIAISLIYAQLYRGNEITVLQACGFSRKQLLMAFMAPALVLISLSAYSMFYLSPMGFQNINSSIAKMRENPFDFFAPNSFFSFDQNQTTLYAHSYDSDNRTFYKMFVQTSGKKRGDTLVVAESGTIEDSGDNLYIILNSGTRYEYDQNNNRYQVAEFARFGQRIPDESKAIQLYGEERLLTLGALYHRMQEEQDTAIYRAQFYWVISLPIMALILSILAFYLCNNRPRHNQLPKLLPIIIVLFAAYFILLEVVKDQVIAFRAGPLLFVAVHLGFLVLTALVANREWLVSRWLRPQL